MESRASGSADEKFTSELEKDVSELSPHLPIAELLNCGLIRVTGYNGFFNVDSVIEPGWLKGKLTLEEYRSAITYVNASVIRFHGKFPRSRLVESLSNRETVKAEAGKNAVDEINRRHKSVRFVYQQGVKEMILHPTWKRYPNRTLHTISDSLACRGTKVFL